MTIDTKSIGGHTPVVTPPPNHDKSAVTTDGGTKQGSADKVTFTVGAEQLRHLESALQGSSGVDMQKVEQIKAAIADGTFKVDSEQIATKLLELEAKLTR